MEGILLIAMLAQQFRFEVAANAQVEPQPGITLRPKYGLPVVVKSRYGQPSRPKKQLLFDAVAVPA